MTDEPLKADEQDAVDRFLAHLAMDELLKRHAGDPAWDTNPPCPTCGSFEHFEC